MLGLNQPAVAFYQSPALDTAGFTRQGVWVSVEFLNVSDPTAAIRVDARLQQSFGSGLVTGQLRNISNGQQNLLGLSVGGRLEQDSVGLLTALRLEATSDVVVSVTARVSGELVAGYSGDFR